MGSSSENPGSETFRGEAREPDSIRRLTAYTCILAAAAIATSLTLVLLQKDEDRRLVQASKLAQDELEKVITDEEMLGSASCALPAEELIVSPASGEKYSRAVKIAPARRDSAETFVTVTVGWETIAGGAHVKMQGRLGTKGPKHVPTGVGE